MSNLVNLSAADFKYVITESTQNGKYYVSRTSPITGLSSSIYIAENEQEVSVWLRTHPEVSNPAFRVSSKPNLAEAMGEQDWGTGNAFTFSSKVTDPELGGNALQRMGSSVIQRLFVKNLLKKALASGSPEGKHPDFTLQPTATGTFGGKEEPSHTVIVHGDVDKNAVANAIATQFKQRAVAGSSTNPVTGYVKEDTMKENDVITESMFQTGMDNTLSGQAQLDYRNMLAGELFGGAAFSTQRPRADTHEGANVVMDTQTTEGLGELRPVGPPSANMNEDTTFNKHMLSMAKSLFRAGRMDEAAKVVDALESPTTSASKVLEAAISTDGVVSAELTEALYTTAAKLNTIAEIK